MTDLTAAEKELASKLDRADEVFKKLNVACPYDDDTDLAKIALSHVGLSGEK